MVKQSSTEQTIDLPVTASPRHPLRWKAWLIVALAIVVVGLVAWLSYRQTGEWFGVGGDATSTALAQRRTVLQAVAKLIVLPTEEEPTIFTIDNAAALAAEQPFYVGAENGDSLIVYSQARKAIIYSSRQRKLVNVGPIVFEGDAASQSPAPTATPAPTRTR